MYINTYKFIGTLYAIVGIIYMFYHMSNSVGFKQKPLSTAQAFKAWACLMLWLPILLYNLSPYSIKIEKKLR